MRIFLISIMFLFASGAHAQQCPECILADACIKEFTQATSKIKAENKKAIADRQKGREQTLRDRFSQRGELVDQGLGALVWLEIDKLKDCLSKVR